MKTWKIYKKNYFARMNQDDSEAKSGGRAIWTNKFGVHKYIR